MRAGTVIIARGEFSIVIAALGASLVDGPDLGALAAAYVLLTAIIGPVATKFADRIPTSRRIQARGQGGGRGRRQRATTANTG